MRAVAGEVISAGRLDLVDELFTPAMARRARRWIEPFLASFHEVRMEVVQLVEEGDTVVGRFSLLRDPRRPVAWRRADGRRFEAVAEVYFFGFEDGRIASTWGLEDTASRLDQLGIASSDLRRSLTQAARRDRSSLSGGSRAVGAQLDSSASRRPQERLNKEIRRRTDVGHLP